jgi:hypothetical protein
MNNWTSEVIVYEGISGITGKLPDTVVSVSGSKIYFDPGLAPNAVAPNILYVASGVDKYKHYYITNTTNIGYAEIGVANNIAAGDLVYLGPACTDNYIANNEATGAFDEIAKQVRGIDAWISAGISLYANCYGNEMTGNRMVGADTIFNASNYWHDNDAFYIWLYQPDSYEEQLYDDGYPYGTKTIYYSDLNMHWGNHKLVNNRITSQEFADISNYENIYWDDASNATKGARGAFGYKNVRPFVLNNVMHPSYALNLLHGVSVDGFNGGPNFPQPQHFYHAHYTLDGSTPTTSSPLFTTTSDPIVLTDSTVVKYILEEDSEPRPVSVEAYNFIGSTAPHIIKTQRAH